MVQFIAGGKGEGKTTKLVGMANAQLKVTDGNLIFIDDKRRSTSDLHYNIRFIEAGKGILSNYREFAGFVLGILAMDSDIKTIYIDGTNKIIAKFDIEELLKLSARLEVLSDKYHVDFITCIDWPKEELPPKLQPLAVNLKG
ncbi:MAG: hypothetical protein FWG65_04795 [Turicibacter sp.]|nr:hypothetical protein [Turicibacter sp.]